MCWTEVDVAAEAVTGLAADFAGLPSWTLDENQLADLEMLLSGVFAPLTGFMTAADVSSVRESGTLADGTAWPVPVTLDVPEDAVPAAQRRLALNDPEGWPLAVLDIRRRTPAQVRAELGEGPVLALVTRRPLNARQIGQLRHVAGQLRARLLLFPLVTGTADVVATPEALVRTVRAAARHLPSGTLVVPLALAAHEVGAEREIALRALVAASYGATHLFTDQPEAPAVATAIPV